MADSYVAPYGDGYIAVVNDQIIGQFATQTEAERAFNDAMGLPNAPLPQTSAPGGAYPTLNVAPLGLMQLQLQAAQAAYLQERLHLLEIPQMMQMMEIQRHQLALNAAINRASQTGWWIDPDFLEGSLAPWTGFPPGALRGTGLAQEDIAKIKQRLRASGVPDEEVQYMSEPEAISRYLRTVPATEDPELVSRLQGAASPVMPNGQYTIEGAQVAANVRPFSDVVSLGGVSPERVERIQERFESRQPTLLARQLAADPRNLAQTMLLTGMPMRNVHKFLAGMPFVRELLRVAGYPERVMAPAMEVPIAKPGEERPGVQPIVPPPSGKPMPPRDVILEPPRLPVDLGTEIIPARTSFLTPEGKFQFLRGHQLPVRGTLRALKTQSPMVPFIQGLMSFAGLNPAAEFGEFIERLPKGGAIPMTRFV